MTGDGAKYCKGCLATQDQTGIREDCGECEGKRPDLFPSNQDAWSLLIAGQTQMRSGGFGVIGFDYLALRWVADVNGIEITPAILRKVQEVERSIIRKQQQETPGG